MGVGTAAAIESRWALLRPVDTTEFDVDRLTVDEATLAASAVVTAHENVAWADLVVRSLSRETNTLVADTRIALLGGGPVADALAVTLVRLGARVEVTTTSPVETFVLARRHGLTGLPTPALSAETQVAITTGEHQPVLDTSAAVDRPLLLVDGARRPGSAATTGPTDGRIRGLDRISGPRTVFTVPRVSPAALDRAVAEVHAVYAVALALVGPAGADATAAESLLT